MPWKERKVEEQKKEFVLRAVRNEEAFVSLCREYGIKPKTGYKWKKRFEEDGLSGLEDRSRRPHSSPKQLGEDAACGLIALKLAHLRWGPKKILELFARKHPGAQRMSLSTVKRILGKAGLVEQRRRRVARECGRIENRSEAKAPNEVWTADFKGWWYSADRRRVEPLTVRDAYSRYVLCTKVLKDSRSETVRAAFEGLFEKYGLPGTIRSDNGPPFASVHAPLGLSRLSVWWVAQGINLDRIRPGHPEENGAHERMHRDIAQEVEEVAEGDLASQAAALEMWCKEFNEERPNEALGMKVPGEMYERSARRYEKGKAELSYPADYVQRRVNAVGTIGLEGMQIRISKTLAAWDVGLHRIGEQRYAVWFGPLCLGEIDLKCETFKAVS